MKNIKLSSLFIFILVVINASDYMSVILKKIDLPNVFYLLFITTIFIITLQSTKQMFTRQTLLVICLLLFYILMSGIVSQYSDINISDTTTSLLSYLIIIIIFVLLRSNTLRENSKILLKVTFYSLLLATLIEISNKISGGEHLAIMFQNNLPFYIFSILLIQKLIRNNVLTKKDKSTYNVSICILLAYILYVFLIRESIRLQYKSIALSVAILIVFYIIEKKTKILNFKKKSSAKLYLFITIPIVIVLLNFLLPILYNDVTSGIARGGSELVRYNVALEMAQTLSENGYMGWLTGLGVGSAAVDFPVEIGSNVYYFQSHSGLATILFEIGFVGLLLVILFLIVSTFQKKGEKNKALTPLYFSSILLMLLLVGEWIFSNVFYAIAAPGPQTYHLSQLSIFLVEIKILTQLKYHQIGTI